MATFDPTTPDEVWYPLPGFPGYEISSDWRYRSFRSFGKGKITERWRLLKPTRLTNGYLVLNLVRDGRSRRVYLHHIMAELAYGPRPDGLQVLHTDDDQFNNFPSNLSYGTPRQNVIDSFRNGKSPRGAARPNAKLDNNKIRSIRRLVEAGVSHVEVARQFGVCRALISMIASGQRWSHV